MVKECKCVKYRILPMQAIIPSEEENKRMTWIFAAQWTLCSLYKGHIVNFQEEQLMNGTLKGICIS